MGVCSRFTRRLTPHHHPHPTAASQQAGKPSYPSPIEGEGGYSFTPAGECGVTPRGRTRRFAAGVCLGTTGLAGLPRVANVRAQEKHKRHPDRPCRDEHPAGRARSLPPDLSRLIATVWWSRRSRRPHGAGLVGRTSQPLHTRRVLERITELARFVKRDRRRGPDPGPVPPCRGLATPAPQRSNFADEHGPGSSPGRRHSSCIAKRPGFWPGLFLVRC